MTPFPDKIVTFFQAQYVQNCYTGDNEKLPFPPANEATGLLKDILDQRKIKILAYGRMVNLIDINIVLQRFFSLIQASCSVVFTTSSN